MRSIVLCLGIFAAFLAVTCGEHKWKKEDNIVILTEEDFDKATKTFKQMLLMFREDSCLQLSFN
jgi:thioredoxin-related protein